MNVDAKGGGQRSEGRHGARRGKLICAGCVLVAIASGCTARDLRTEQLLRDHLVAFRYDGTPLDPAKDMYGWKIINTAMEPLEYRERVKSIAHEIRKFLSEDPGGTRHRVLIFIHGGLNGYSDSIARVRDSAEEMRRAGFYPIFIAWNSGLRSSYFIDSLFVQAGRFRAHRAPIYAYLIARDVAGGILNTPIRVWDGLWRTISPRERSTDSEEALSLAKGLIARYERSQSSGARDPPGAVPIAMGEFEPSGLADWYRFAWWSPRPLFKPLHWLEAPLFDAIGEGGWNGMLRRAGLLFEVDEESSASSDPAAEGRGITCLLKELSALQEGEDQALLRDLQGTLRTVSIRLRLTEDAEPGRMILGDEIASRLRSTGAAVASRLREARETGTPLPAHMNAALVVSHLASVYCLLFRLTEQAVEDLPGKTGAAMLGCQVKVAQHVAHIARALVVDALREERRREPKIHLYGHSMGAIVVNRILRKAEHRDVPRFEKIVYMAAACTVNDYLDSAVPYLKNKKEYGVECHHLLLHPEAEASQCYACGLAPEGSLLVWIDEYFNKPRTLGERTAGRFVNLMRALEATPREVRDQLRVKIFPAGAGGGWPAGYAQDEDAFFPGRHEDFSRMRFWESGFTRLPELAPGEP